MSKHCTGIARTRVTALLHCIFVFCIFICLSFVRLISFEIRLILFLSLVVVKDPYFRVYSYSAQVISFEINLVSKPN